MLLFCHGSGWSWVAPGIDLMIDADECPLMSEGCSPVKGVAVQILTGLESGGSAYLNGKNGHFVPTTLLQSSRS